MKKLLTFILAGTMVFTLAACGGEKAETGKEGKGAEAPVTEKAAPDFETLKAEYQEKTAEELISENIKDSKNPTDEEIAALAKTGAYGEIGEQYVFEINITDEALNSLRKEQIKTAYATNYAESLINDEEKMVRAYLYNSFADYVPLDDEELENMILEKIKAETDTTVIACALNGFKNALSKRTEFADFAIEHSKNEDPIVRYWAATALGFYCMEDSEKCVDALIPLMKDSDEEVAKVACKEIGGFGNEKVVDAINEILADETLVNLHGPATDSLEDLWMNFPIYDGASEAAYRAHIAYLNIDSGNPDIPSWLSVASLTNPGGKYEEWKNASTYFNAGEVVAVLTKIASNTNVDKLTRTTAVQKIGSFGTAADLEALKSMLASDDAIISTIDTQLAK